MKFRTWYDKYSTANIKLLKIDIKQNIMKTKEKVMQLPIETKIEKFYDYIKNCNDLEYLKSINQLLKKATYENIH